MQNKVQAFCHNGKWHDIGVEDDVTAYLQYPNGATGVFVTTTGDYPGTNRFEITLDGFYTKSGYPFLGQLILDCINRTENAMTQYHAFKAAGESSIIITNLKSL